MPAYWTRKEERQYEHILKSCRARRGGLKRCKRIAAATVNKQRARALSGPFSGFSGLGRMPGERAALVPPRPRHGTVEKYCLARDPFTKKCKIYGTRRVR